MLLCRMRLIINLSADDVHMQVIVDDYMRSEAVLKESRMHDELDLDGERCPFLGVHGMPEEQVWAAIHHLTLILLQLSAR